MARIARPGRRLASAALFALALTTTGAEARGFGGGFHAGAIGPRVGAWGRPLGPVRPGVEPGGGFGRPGFVGRPLYAHRHWHRGYWGYRYGYGLGGFGLGLGLGGVFGAYGDPWYYDDTIYTPPIYVAPVEVPVETEVVTDDSAAIAACARRFRTYDPRTQTFIGKGYVRRRCP
ncbi:BA14K family protein [Methylobacterium sp. 2A]|jgi:BA14K-like protein|nr:BA14K family protein [Methylobacterium sp. 2A]MWV23656.1 BA14K family protein [Methylobacterium sp. 2A]